MTLAQLGVGRLVGGRYDLEAPIGRGGMGEVWRARHVALASAVAIKFLHAASAESESSRRRFLTEAQVTANLRSRYAVRVFDFGVTEDGLPYLVMELLEGETLDRRIARHGKLTVESAARVLQRAARALARAHQLGIVHRDFKPENIMLVADDEEGGDGDECVKVVDFGVAKLVGALDETLKSAIASVTHRDEGRSPTSFSVTSTGLGTPFYMAPEQVSGAGRIGPAADVWAFGVVAYECLTGRRPFGGDTVGDLLLKVLMASPPPPAADDGVPAAFDAWFAKACARDANQRFRDIGAAVTALLEALGQPATDAPRTLDAPPSAPPEARPRSAPSRRGIAAIVAIAATAVGALALHDGPVRGADPPVIASRDELDREPEIAPPRETPRVDVPAAIPVAPPPAASADPTAAPADPPPAPPPHGARKRARLPPLGL